MTRRVRFLAVADEVDSRLYRAGLTQARQPPDVLVGCGDLPAYYLDFLVSQLDAPLYAVHGNHDAPAATYEGCGASWIGGRTVEVQGTLLAGLDGSHRYNGGAYQYTQSDMHVAARRLAPWLWLNRFRYGRFLDVLITHAPPRGIHDESDVCHVGLDAFRWLLRTFRPRYHLHGHVHDPGGHTLTRLGPTEIINVYPYREVLLELPVTGRRPAQTGRAPHPRWPRVDPRPRAIQPGAR